MPNNLTMFLVLTYFPYSFQYYKLSLNHFSFLNSNSVNIYRSVSFSFSASNSTNSFNPSSPANSSKPVHFTNSSTSISSANFSSPTNSCISIWGYMQISRSYFVISSGNYHKILFIFLCCSISFSNLFCFKYITFHATSNAYSL